MGYDAIVRCNCWSEGKTKPYPFDYDFHFDDGCDIALDLPEDAPDYMRKLIALGTWLEDCCEHQRMFAAWEHITNRAGMYDFKAALSQLGWEQFPILHAELPVLNAGSVSPDKVDAFLEELNKFTKQNSEDFDYIIQPLLKLCEVSKVTGNPICWG